jgi:hypothetical protein
MIYTAGYVDSQVSKDVIKHLLLGLKVSDNISVKLRSEMEPHSLDVDYVISHLQLSFLE